MKIKGREIKVRAYADDVVLVVEDPIENIPKVLKLLNEFGDQAGLKINKEKSAIITCNMTKKKQETLQGKIGIRIQKKVKYLGIYITKKNSDLFDKNYKKGWQEIKKNLGKWDKLQLSLLGRIALIKMSIQPKSYSYFKICQ